MIHIPHPQPEPDPFDEIMRANMTVEDMENLQNIEACYTKALVPYDHERDDEFQSKKDEFDAEVGEYKTHAVEMNITVHVTAYSRRRAVELATDSQEYWDSWDWNTANILDPPDCSA